MWSFRNTMRRARDRARRLPASLRRTGRRPLALAIAAGLLLSALGPPAAAPVAAAPAGPAARLQLVVKQVEIHNDREGFLSGEGDMTLFFRIWHCNEGIPPPCSSSYSAEPIVRRGIFFGASTGDIVTLDREVPRFGDEILREDTSPELGIPIYAGQYYTLEFEIQEFDGGGETNYDEHLGYVEHVLDTGEHGLGLGTHTARSVREDGVSAGDYTITYEIRKTPLPDLRPVNIQVQELPGSGEKRVCMTVLNSEIGHAFGPFEVALRVDGRVPADGRYTVGLLAAGTSYLACVETALQPGPHLLAAVVDERGAVNEFNERNNVYEQPYTAASGSSSPMTTPSQAQPQADLTVSAIRVNGQAPDGKDDCKDGRNDVAVVVKNGGTGKAGSFAVRLVVDGDDDEAKEKLVADLEAGQEREVRFDDVRLKKGERKLAAIADAKGAVAESKEDDNELKVSARCKDGG